MKDAELFHTSFCWDHFIDEPWGVARDEKRFRYANRGEMCHVAGCGAVAANTERKWPGGLSAEIWRTVPWEANLEEGRA